MHNTGSIGIHHTTKGYHINGYYTAVQGMLYFVVLFLVNYVLYIIRVFWKGVPPYNTLYVYNTYTTCNILVYGDNQYTVIYVIYGYGTVKYEVCVYNVYV